MNLIIPFVPYITAYSTSWINNPVMSVVFPFPTVKLAELRTHRTLYQSESENIILSENEKNISLNANSSRAIPIKKQLESCINTPFVPIWTKNQKGMQGSIIDNEDVIHLLNFRWKAMLKSDSSTSIKNMVNSFANLEIHKQDVSLLLNPYSWTTCIATADKNAWDSFFELRCPKYKIETKNNNVIFAKSKKEYIEIITKLQDKETDIKNINWNKINESYVYPAVQVIAEYIYDLWKYTKPNFLKEGEWHISFIEKDDKKEYYNNENYNATETALILSISRCAMISFDNQSKKENLDIHVNRAKKLITEKHVSTMEHQLQVPYRVDMFKNNPMDYQVMYLLDKEHNPYLHIGKYISNIHGWIQLRKVVEFNEFLFNF